MSNRQFNMQFNTNNKIESFEKQKMWVQGTPKRYTNISG